jgi:transposase
LKSQYKLPETLEEAHQEILMLRQKNAELEERLQRLEEMLGLNSKNSSKPPSSDFTKAKPKLRKLKKSKGNDRKARQLWPEEKVNQIFVCPPPEVCDCGGVVHVHGKPYVHEHFELPEIEPVVTHYHLLYGCCQKCHKNHQGELPKGTHSGIIGPKLLALSGVLSGHYHLSKAKICLLFHDLLGINVAIGTLSEHEELLSDSLEACYDEIHAVLQQSVQVYMDETSFRQGNRDGNNAQKKRAWVWVMLSQHLTLFKIALGRGKAQARELLGDHFEGMVCSDRYNAYHIIPESQRSHCWAHLLRDFQRIAERPGECGEIGKGLVEHGVQVFIDWQRYQSGELKPSTFKYYTRTLRKNVRSLLEQGAGYQKVREEKSLRAQTASTCRSLLKVEQCLWNFAKKEIEPSKPSAVSSFAVLQMRTA